ncbi:hypothetical protein [Enterococcus dongliensis]|uniref:hypothetical protein n=1 Tax=Enterococcus dongliensis TaxID=2559925 RepID=UPI00288E7DCD|nr:hypothetical protein [Enterococcus dongliensis]MDT2712399.1 hypothetical protein [Enterococcus dongliensis]
MGRPLAKGLAVVAVVPEHWVYVTSVTEPIKHISMNNEFSTPIAPLQKAKSS